MIHDSTWLDLARTMCRRRLMAPLGLTLACALLATLPAAALATGPEVRGEWEIVIKSSGEVLKGETVITQEANAQGEFSSPTHGIHFEDGGTGTFSGTLEGGKATVLVIADPVGPYSGEFTSSTLTVNSGPGTLSLTGEGTITFSGTTLPNAQFTATRLRSQQQIEEREAQEKKEREEREAKERVRGEWAITFEAGPQVVKGVALVTEEANSKEEFASSSALFESVVLGTFSGTMMGAEASVKITTQATGPYPGGTFEGTKLVVSATSSSLSIAGVGTLTLENSPSFPASLTATRIKTYQQVVKEREVKEMEAREAKEKTEREAKEKTEGEAKEKTEREAGEKAAREAKEKQEREAVEAKQKTEREAGEKAAREAKEKTERAAREAAEKANAAKNAQLAPVQLTGKAFTVSAGGVLSLQISNPNAYAISGRITLNAAGTAKASKGMKGSFGTASFGVSPQGAQTVKVKLSRSGRLELARHKALRVLSTITTEAEGKTTITRTVSFTLKVAKALPGKH